jgi:hypothetical protein
MELLASQGRSMHAREVVDLLTDDDAEVLEAHPVDALVNGRDELDERDRSPVEDIERLGEHDQGDRTPVPEVLAVRPRVALEKRALVDVKVPIGDADGEVAERVGCDVDAAGNKTVALHRREGLIVPDDVPDRIGHPGLPLPATSDEHVEAPRRQGRQSDIIRRELDRVDAPEQRVTCGRLLGEKGLRVMTL